MLVHGDNLRQKEGHATKYRDDASRRYLSEIRAQYDVWHKANEELIGPGATLSADDTDSRIINERVVLFEKYKDFIDKQHYAEKFDSRSNLHSSVLEEFVYYLFRDLVRAFGDNALIGKSHAFKDLFFVPPNYPEMLHLPYARIERKDHDFVIGATIEATLRTVSRSPAAEAPGEEVVIPAEKPKDYEEVAVAEGVIVGEEGVVAGDTETHKFDVPAVVIECKTYLDKTMLEGSSRAAEDLKARNPNALYIVVAEYLKLTEAVNLRKFKLDQIYVLRRQRNTDRELRYGGWEKKPVDPAVIRHLFNLVRMHLITDWAGSIREGMERGWLL